MTIIQGSDIPNPSNSGICQSEFKQLRKKKNISLETTGDKKTNALLSYLQCQIKKDVNVKSSCNNFSKEYTKCHQSFMGTGSYKGRQNCSHEMKELYDCVLNASE